jgi:signal transduction histidine kinase
MLEKYVKENLEEHAQELKPIIEMIEIGFTRVSDIIRSLNHFNRSENVIDQRCDLVIIIKNCLVMIHGQIKERININEKYSNESLLMLGNEGELHQVLLNVLTNSYQAIRYNGEININGKIAEKKIYIEIEDTGKGISRGDIKKVTEPFFTTKDPGKGTGLGMSIAYSIIKKHNGAIRYTSEEGKGTSVQISFPAI